MYVEVTEGRRWNVFFNFLRQHCIDNNLWLRMAILICVQNLAGTGLGGVPEKCKCKFWNINAHPAGMYPLCDSYEIVRISRYFYVQFKFSIWLHLLKGFWFYRGFVFGVYVSTNISLWCNVPLIHLFSLALCYCLFVYLASHTYFFRLHHNTAHVHTASCYRPSSVVCRSVCRTVGRSICLPH